MDNKILTLIDYIKKSSNIVLFTGAGISVPSGIPDFRSDNGLYSNLYKRVLKPEVILSHSFFIHDPKTFYEYYFDKIALSNKTYNDAHKFFSALEEEGKLKAVVTQNIDSLHEASGSKVVYKLHGSISDNYCMKCNKYYSLNKTLELYNKYNHIPKCSCGGIIKPDVVLYEEPLDDAVLNSSIKAISCCDLLIVVGTSLTVSPANFLLSYFKGKSIVLINKSTTSMDNLIDLVIHDDIINVINIMRELWNTK